MSSDALAALAVLPTKSAACCVCGEERMFFHSQGAYAVARYHWRCSDACEDRWAAMRKPTFMCRLAECKCDEAPSVVNDQGVLKLVGEDTPVKKVTPERPEAEPPAPKKACGPSSKRVLDEKQRQDDTHIDSADRIQRAGLLRRYRVDDRRDWPARLPEDRIGNVEASLQYLMEELRMLRDALPRKIEEIAYEVAVDAARDAAPDVSELVDRITQCEEDIRGLSEQ